MTNTQLVKEKAQEAILYNNQSVAELHSINICWSILMGKEFDHFRSMLCSSVDEQQRFRQLVVNCVLATDITDKELKKLRNDRWDKAFVESEGRAASEDPRVSMNRKATIVIEHLIQASDVAHTMQHWHVYLLWNERFFRECYKAYKDGRSLKNPLDSWYHDEIGFFDYYM